MQIDHIGIAVKSLEEGLRLWCDHLGYRQATDPVVNSRQKVRVVFLKKDDSIDIKLVEPVDDSSPVYSLARRGGGLHHLCFRCRDLEETLGELKNFGMRILALPQPGEAFEGEPIAFVYAGHGINLELIATTKRAAKR